MRRVKWLAAVLAVGVMVPYCEQLRRVMINDDNAVTTTAVPDERGGAHANRGTRTAAAATSATTATIPTATRATARAATTGAPVTPTSTSTTPTTEDETTTSAALPSVMTDDWASGKFAGFTKAEADEMAARCELRWQMPRVTDGKYVSAVRALYLELTGDADSAARLPLRALDDALRSGSDDDPIAVHKRLAQRRAGDRVDGTGGVYERYLQLQLDESERAHRDGDELGARFTATGCDPDNALFRSAR